MTLRSTQAHASPWLLGLCILLACAFSFDASAQSDEQKTRQQLEALEKSIASITREIADASTRRSRLQKALRDAEVDMGRVRKSIAATEVTIEEQETELARLQSEQQALEKARDEQQQHIAKELRAAWRSGDQGQLKVLLNQNDPDKFARAMTYYRYVFEARENLLERYRTTLTEIQTLTARIDETLAQLAIERETLLEQSDALSKTRARREIAILDLGKSIDSKSKELKQLKTNREELETLLRAIEEAVVNLQVPDNFQAFSEAKGKMPWPVAGKPSNRYGRMRNAGKMRWQGLTIPAKEGTAIHAIHHGRVVYADWLRGSGLLLIIDHGEGYMSLYAHNSSLLKDVGEWVSAGTPIATAGNSGGKNRSALYFEIRHNGKPTDPAKWCTE